MKRLCTALIFAFLFAVCAHGQPASRQFLYVAVDPGGACANGTANQYNYVLGKEWGCKNGTWTLLANGGGGSFTPWPGSSGQITSNQSGVGTGSNLLEFNPTALPVPAAPGVTTAGMPGITTYEYALSWHTPLGDSNISASRIITTGNATLGMTNYNVITVPTAPAFLTGTVTVDICEIQPQSLFVANVAAGSIYNDQNSSKVGDSCSGGDATVGAVIRPTFTVGQVASFPALNDLANVSDGSLIIAAHGSPLIALIGASNPALNTGTSNGTLEVPTASVDTDLLYDASFNGFVSNKVFRQGAEIQAKVDGAPTASTVPGRLSFITTKVGGGSQTNLDLRSDGSATFSGLVIETAILFANLGTPANGTQIFCSNCTVTSGIDDTCATGGTGAQAFRINGAWKCVQ